MLLDNQKEAKMAKIEKRTAKHPAEVLAAALSAETVLKVVHGTAGPLACLVAAAEVDAEVRSRSSRPSFRKKRRATSKIPHRLRLCG